MQAALSKICGYSVYPCQTLPNPRSPKWHGRRRTANTAWQLRLIRAPAMFDAIGEAGVDGGSAEMEIGFTRMSHRPAAHALVQIQQRCLVRHLCTRLCSYQSARRCRRYRGLLITRALAHEPAGADGYDARHRRHGFLRRGMTDHIRCVGV